MSETTKPVRVQLSRRKGWMMPPNTVSVARPARWGNPFAIYRSAWRGESEFPIRCATAEEADELLALLRSGADVTIIPADAALLDRLAVEGMASFRSLIETECPWDGPEDGANAQAGWWDTSCIYDGIGDTDELGANALLSLAVGTLSCLGLIERKPDAPHLVRFVEE